MMVTAVSEKLHALLTRISKRVAIVEEQTGRRAQSVIVSNLDADGTELIACNVVWDGFTIYASPRCPRGQLWLFGHGSDDTADPVAPRCDSSN
jgi:hypothetical protein